MQLPGRTCNLGFKRALPKNGMPALTSASVRALASSKAKEARRNDLPVPLSSAEQSWRTVAERVGKQIGAGLAGVALTASLLLSPPAHSEVVRLPASSNPEIFAAQRTLVEAWGIIAEAFVDSSFNGHDWEGELRSHMVAAFRAPDGDSAYKELEEMLEDLGDPYTRRIPPEEYQSFRMSSDGELQGVGLLIANEPRDGHLLVLAPIKGGPAERAGVMPGDVVISINGQSTAGWTGEKAARILRGAGGTEVRVQLARRSEQIPGVPGRPEPMPEVQYRELRLKRERVVLSPLFATTLAAPPPEAAAALGSTAAAAASSQGPVGYIRLTSFSNNAPQAMRQAIRELQAKGASSYILDLRSNPGGLVQSGIDIAHLWLDGNPVVFNVTGRAGEETIAQRVDPEDTLRALTHDPLVVLVNSGSASASEILSGALHDNARAAIVGDSHTYGKGRIQSVYELQDGSALFVTIAKYLTPGGTEIDKKGIQPDMACAPPLNPDFTFMPGIPVDGTTRVTLMEQLGTDGCMITARKLLAEQLAARQVQQQQAVAAAAAPAPGQHV